MRVTDVISSYQDLLPNQRASTPKLFALTPADFHPSVESFDLADAPADLLRPHFHAMDTVQIFSRSTSKIHRRYLSGATCVLLEHINVRQIRLPTPSFAGGLTRRRRPGGCASVPLPTGRQVKISRVS